MALEIGVSHTHASPLPPTPPSPIPPPHASCPMPHASCPPRARDLVSALIWQSATLMRDGQARSAHRRRSEMGHGGSSRHHLGGDYRTRLGALGARVRERAAVGAPR